MLRLREQGKKNRRESAQKSGAMRRRGTQPGVRSDERGSSGSAEQLEMRRSTWPSAKFECEESMGFRFRGLS
jgi:hypothetical protein